MSRDLLKYFGEEVRKIYAVLDRSQIVRDLTDLRIATGKSQREFADDAGINYGKVNRIETGQAYIGIDDLDKWLAAAGSNLMAYLNQYEIAEELKELQEDRDLAEACARAIKIPAKRELLRVFLRTLFAEDKLRGKAKQ